MIKVYGKVNVEAVKKVAAQIVRELQEKEEKVAC